MKSYAFLIASILATLILIGQAPTTEAVAVEVYKAKTCSTVFDYAMGVQACWVPYIMGIMEPLILMGANPQLGTTIEEVMMDVMQKFKSGCGAPLDRATSCHSSIDEWCGYRIVPVKRFKDLITSLCINIDNVIGEVATCANPGIYTFIGILSNFSYVDDICKMSNRFQTIVGNLMNGCSSGVQDFFGKAVNAFLLESCADNAEIKNTGAQCAGISSLATTAMCYTGFITQMIGSIPMGGPMAKYATLCQQTGGVLDKAIECHKAVEDKCGFSYVNPAEMMKFKTASCAALTIFGNFSQCVTAQTGMDVLLCMNNITLINNNNDDMLCSVTSDFQGCTTSSFDKCPMVLQKFVRKANDMIALPCPHQQSNPQCSMIELTATLAMCWYPSIQMMVPWDKFDLPYNAEQYINNLCNNHRDALTNSVECMRQAQERCDFVWISDKTITDIVDMACGLDIQQMMGIVNCVDMTKLQALNSCMLKIKDIEISVSADGNHTGFCEMGEVSKTCMKNMFSSCTAYIQETFDEALTILYGDSNACMISGTTTTTPTTTTSPTSGARQKQLSLAVVTSLVLAAVNGNVNGLMTDWVGMIARGDEL